MGRLETEWLATDANLEALTDLSGAWIDRVHQRKPPEGIILDLDGQVQDLLGILVVATRSERVVWRPTWAS
jgi:hypothetical protein